MRMSRVKEYNGNEMSAKHQTPTIKEAWLYRPPRIENTTHKDSTDCLFLLIKHRHRQRQHKTACSACNEIKSIIACFIHDLLKQ